MLKHVLNELMGDSAVAGSTISIKNRISISCNSCFNSLQTEDICFVLQLTVCSDIQTSLNSIFISECLQGENAPFCHLCASKQDAESQLSICEVGCYVIVQLKRFFMIHGVATKNAAHVVCSPYLSVSRFMVRMERGDFVVNSQQDVPEVLNYILDNFCGVYVLAQDQLKVVIRNRITCMNCLQSDGREDIHMIVKLNVAGNVNNRRFS